MGGASTNPPPGTLLPPTAPSAANMHFFTQLSEGTHHAHDGRVPPPSAGPGGLPSAFLETEGPNGGVPSIPASTVNLLDFDNSSAYSPIHAALSAEELNQHIGAVAQLEWVKVSEASFSCVDGRYTDSVLGTQGGDFGELLLALNVFEQMSTKRLSQDETSKILNKYLSHTKKKKFAMCTDQKSVNSLLKAVGGQSEDISMPSENVRDELMLRVTAPEFVGDNHVRLMLRKSDQYTVRKGLVENLIRAF